MPCDLCDAPAEPGSALCNACAWELTLAEENGEA